MIIYERRNGQVVLQLDRNISPSTKIADLIRLEEKCTKI